MVFNRLFGHQLALLKHENHYWKVGFWGLVVADVLHLLFIPLFLFLHVPVLAAINVVSVGMYAYAIFGLGDQVLITHDDTAVGWIVYAELLLHGLAATYYLGCESGFQYYIYLLALLPFFVPNQTLPVYLLRFGGIVGASLFIQWYFRSPRAEIDPAYIRLLGYANLTVFLSVAGLIVYFYTRFESEYRRLLISRSQKDTLTGLWTRQYFSSFKTSWFSNHHTKGKKAGLLIIDIDNFKSVNDRYGHIVGDHVIEQVASSIQTLLRPDDVAVRWGGDEFIVFLPDVDERALGGIGRTVVQRVREKVDETTVTCGGALLRSEESFSDLFVRADEALYRAKTEGRNRCIIDEAAGTESSRA